MSGSHAAAGAVVDLRQELRAAGDQGTRGTCVAFVVTAVHEHDARPADTSRPDDLSEETLHWGCKQLGGMAGPGTRMSAADLALQRWGQPREVLWPYDPKRDDQADDYQPPPEALDPKNCLFSALRTVNRDLYTIRAVLDVGVPVIAALQIWPQLRHPTTEPLPTPVASDLLPTFHAVVIVGYDAARSALLIRNSWGTGWGTDGHLWLADGIVNHLTGAWAIDNTVKNARIATADGSIAIARSSA